MSNTDMLAKYSFLPWLRQGIANNIENLPQGNARRASIEVAVYVVTDTNEKATVTRTVELVSARDITGISRDAIVRHEPRHWSTDFEPNYLPYIEFYDEDFVWRYSPMPADTVKHRIIPWLTLVVLKEDEFGDANAQNGPLPSFELEKDVDATVIFPPTTQLWAWAHVHVNFNIKSDANDNPIDLEQSIDMLQDLLEKNPDMAYSRLLCPRKLDPNTGYHAFVIPGFEAGRLAGLGEDIGNEVGALDIAWGSGQKSFPYYYRWYFRTGVRGDFEYLVRLLEPRPVDQRVGIRDMDVSDPGAGIDGIDMGEGQPEVIGMEGALRSPETRSTEWPRSYPGEFQEKLAERINEAADYQEANPTEDPIITPPLYARWHALRQRLSLSKDTGENPYDPEAKWVTELNLDPRHRAEAGLGTRVVQEHQEEYMNQAWEQIGDIRKVNQRLNMGNFAKTTGTILYKKHLLSLPGNLQFSITAPVHKLVLGSDQTVYRKVQLGKLPCAVISPQFRKILRPRGAVSRKLLSDTERRPQTHLISRINEGEITATPPKTSPGGATTLEDAVKKFEPRLPKWLQNLLRNSWFKWLPFSLALLLVITLLLVGVSTVVWAILGPGAAILTAASVTFNQWAKSVAASDTFREENLTPEAVDQLPKSPSFRITALGDTTTFPAGNTDSKEARRFKSALRDLYTVLANGAGPSPGRPPLQINKLVDSIMTGINPIKSISNRVLDTIDLPPHIRKCLSMRPEQLDRVMAYPEFPQPMYEPLRDLSTEFLIPNINLVPQNTISLLETNQKFIESYMVGLNHEMARELLWREYPTDQRGSYFRQFWEVRDFVSNDPSITEEQLAEKLKDIPEIHTWPNETELGTHNHREAGGDTNQLVFLIRGDLLKRYPTTVIYAHRAQWARDKEGNILKDQSRELAPTETDAQRAVNEKYPLYYAKIEPDIYFLGYDLTAAEAKGINENDPGWFFVLKERPGESRFGLDLEDESVSSNFNDWDDMSWGDIKDDLPDGGCIQLTADKNKIKPQNNLENVEWNSDSNAADIAYILYQDPVLAAVHAQEMLKESF